MDKMFTQKKKNYKTFLYSAIVITLCLLVIALAWPQEGGDATNPINTNAEARIYEGDKQVDSIYDTSLKGQQDIQTNDTLPEYGEDFDESRTDQPAGNSDDYQDEKSNMPNPETTYYLVKKADGGIKVFFVNNQGNAIELETTNIIYEVLGPEDQRLFEQGYKVKTQEELAVLLQDFES